MRLLETIRRDLDAQKRRYQQEEVKLANLEREYSAALNALVDTPVPFGGTPNDGRNGWGG